MSDVYETLYYEGEIERLKIELAEANAKIEAVREIHHAHSVLTAECVSCRGIFPCRTIRALESATPQGSLAGSTIREENGTTGGSPIRCDTDRCNSHRSDIACFLSPCPCRCHKSEVDPEC